MGCASRPPRQLGHDVNWRTVARAVIAAIEIEGHGVQPRRHNFCVDACPVLITFILFLLRDNDVTEHRIFMLGQIGAALPSMRSTTAWANGLVRKAAFSSFPLVVVCPVVLECPPLILDSEC